MFTETDDKKFLLKSLITGEGLVVNHFYCKQKEIAEKTKSKTEVAAMVEGEYDIVKNKIKEELNIGGEIKIVTTILNGSIIFDLPNFQDCPFEKKKHKSSNTRFIYYQKQKFIIRSCSHHRCNQKHKEQGKRIFITTGQ